MKKKFLVLGIMVLVIAMCTGVAGAVNKSNTGCGLGYLLFKDTGDSVLTEILAVTTNATLFNQTFGMTTGTLECEKPQSFASDERLNSFVAKNMDNLAVDIAAGQGESLDTLAELMQVPAGQRTGFYAKLQGNFSNIFTSDDVQSAQVIDNIVKVAG